MPGRSAYKCPLCNSAAQPVYEHPETRLLRCGVCDHCYADLDTIETREDYSLSYGDDQHKNWFENPNLELFGEIETELREAGVRSVLDLGCGRGDFLRYLRAHHESWRLVGIEQTAFEAPADFELVTGDIDDFDTTERFDAVVSLAVIEHLDDPVSFLRRAGELCQPGGTVVTMTLNERSVLYATSRLLRRVGLTAPFDQLYSTHHVHHFNKTSLQAAFDAADMRVERRIDHNIATDAIDFPGRGRAADLVRKWGAQASFALGDLTGRCYLQTVICRSETTAACRELATETGQEQPEFDTYADSYRAVVDESVAFSGQDTDYFARRKVDVISELSQHVFGDTTELTCLDVGCGIGVLHPSLEQHFQTVVGADVSEQTMARALAANSGRSYLVYNGGALPVADDRVDVVLCVNVFHHVPVQSRRSLMDEIQRVVRPGGLVVVIEHNPFNPLTRLAVARCEFDDDAVLLRKKRATELVEGAGMHVVASRFIVFTLSYREWVRKAESKLGWLPAGAQFIVAGRLPVG